MSKKHKRNRKPKTTTILKKDKFYNVHDGSEKGHPGIITDADYSKDEYRSVITETSNPHNENIRLSHPTDSKVEKSYIKPKPFLGIREDYGNKEYPDMEIHEDDLEKVKLVDKRKPTLGKWFKKKKKPS